MKNSCQESNYLQVCRFNWFPISYRSLTFKSDASLRLSLLTVFLHEYVREKDIGKHQSGAEDQS